MLIHSERVGLRNLQPSDAASLLILNADPEVMRYSHEPRFPSVAAMQAFIRTSPHTQPNQPAFWAVETLDSHMFVGFCGLKGGNELGFRLFRSQWRRGYATEAALLACYLGFEQFNLPHIVAETHRDNHASLAVLNKLRMTVEADTPNSVNERHFILNKSDFMSYFQPIKRECGAVHFMTQLLK